MLNGAKIEDFMKMNKFSVHPRLFGLIQAMSQIKSFGKIWILNRYERLDIGWGIKTQGAVVLINSKNNFEIFDKLKFYKDVGDEIEHPSPVFTCKTIEECCKKLHFFMLNYYT
jgi:hypothetical protein